MPYAKTEQEAQAIFLQEERTKNKDPQSNAVMEGNALNQEVLKSAPMRHSDPLRQFIEVDHFGSAKAREETSGLIPQAESLIDQSGALNYKGLSVEEEEMVVLASNYSEFNI